jgi:hypothetical protein
MGNFFAAQSTSFFENMTSPASAALSFGAGEANHLMLPAICASAQISEFCATVKNQFLAILAAKFECRRVVGVDIERC